MKTVKHTEYHLITGGAHHGLLGTTIGAGLGAGTYAYSQHMAGKTISSMGLIGSAILGALTSIFNGGSSSSMWRPKR